MNGKILKKSAKNKKNTAKTHKNNAIFLLFVAFLVVLTGLLLAKTLAYFSSVNIAGGRITLAELDFTVCENNANSSVFVSPGESVAKSVSVVNSRNQTGDDCQNLCSFFLRFNYEILIDESTDSFANQNITLSIDSGEFVEYDGYYYHIGSLSAGERVDLFGGVNFGFELGNYYQSKRVDIVLNVDAVQSENDAIDEVWNKLPQAIREQLKGHAWTNTKIIKLFNLLDNIEIIL